MDWFSYFMIRVRRSDTQGRASAEMAGLVEQLSSGDKRTFATADELLNLVRHWPDSGPEPSSIMLSDSDIGKTNVSGTHDQPTEASQ